MINTMRESRVYSYFDLTAVWHAMSNLELRTGVNSLLDKDPPLVPSGRYPPAIPAQRTLGGLTIIWAASSSFAFSAKF